MSQGTPNNVHESTSKRSRFSRGRQRNNPRCSWLVVLTTLKNMKVNGKDYPIYYGQIKNVPNHQSVNSLGNGKKDVGKWRTSLHPRKASLSTNPARTGSPEPMEVLQPGARFYAVGPKWEAHDIWKSPPPSQQWTVELLLQCVQYDYNIYIYSII